MRGQIGAGIGRSSPWRYLLKAVNDETLVGMVEE